MSRSFFEDLVATPMSANLAELNHKFILETMLGPSHIETVSTEGDIALEGATPKVVSMEARASVPMALRSPRSTTTLV